MMQKETLNLEDIEAQTALELPDRQMMAIVQSGLVNVNVSDINVNIPVNVDIQNVLNNNTVIVDIL
jgi:hypothetical protein